MPTHTRTHGGSIHTRTHGAALSTGPPTSTTRNEAALERSLPRLAPEARTPSAPDAPPAPRFSALELGLPAACTRAQVLLADVRVARGRALIVATLVLVVAAALLLRSAEKVLERVRMARVMRALRELARPDPVGVRVTAAGASPAEHKVEKKKTR